MRLRKKYGNVQTIGFDASRPELGMSLKKKIDERYDWQYVQDKIQYCKNHNLDLANYMVIVPILFNAEFRSFMTSHSRRISDDPKGYLVIHPSLNKLITALKSVQIDDTGKLLKDGLPYNDILETFQMMCTFFKFKSSGEYQ